jgi:hypothetical protein
MFTNFEKTILFLCFSAALCALYGFLTLGQHFGGDNDKMTGVIGHIEKAKNDTRRKYYKDVAWSTLGGVFKVYDDEMLYVGSNSSLKLKLMSGGEIEIGEKSIISLMRKQDGVEIEIKHGQVNAKLVGSDRVKVGETVFKSKGSGLNEGTSIHLVHKKEGETKLNIIEGEVHLEHNDSTEKNLLPVESYTWKGQEQELEVSNTQKKLSSLSRVFDTEKYNLSFIKKIEKQYNCKLKILSMELIDLKIRSQNNNELVFFQQKGDEVNFLCYEGLYLLSHDKTDEIVNLTVSEIELSSRLSVINHSIEQKNKKFFVKLNLEVDPDLTKTFLNVLAPSHDEMSFEFTSQTSFSFPVSKAGRYFVSLYGINHKNEMTKVIEHKVHVSAEDLINIDDVKPPVILNKKKLVL